MAAVETKVAMAATWGQAPTAAATAAVMAAVPTAEVRATEVTMVAQVRGRLPASGQLPIRPSRGGSTPDDYCLPGTSTLEAPAAT